MTFSALPFRSSLTAYEQQANALLAAWRAADPQAIRVFREHHPRFLDERIPWLPKRLSDAEVQAVRLDRSDARLATARCYSFQSWPDLVAWVETVARPGSPVATFESAVQAVIAGDEFTLEQLLQGHPKLVRARSTLVTHHDPPVHGATLLHYLAANGVEDWRQQTPKNAVRVARQLLDAGADPDALAGMYGGQHATMSMLVSSSHPATAGVQVALVDTLVDYGASVEARGVGEWTSPLATALAFGFRDAAEALVRRGARVDNVATAAGLGRLERVRALLPTSASLDRHRALTLAAQHGHVEIVQLLLDAGETRTVTTQRVITLTPPLCTRPSGRVRKRSSTCSSSEGRVWISRTRSGRARRWAGLNTANAPRSQPIFAGGAPRHDQRGLAPGPEPFRFKRNGHSNLCCLPALL